MVFALHDGATARVVLDELPRATASGFVMAAVRLALDPWAQPWAASSTPYVRLRSVGVSTLSGRSRATGRARPDSAPGTATRRRHRARAWHPPASFVERQSRFVVPFVALPAR